MRLGALLDTPELGLTLLTGESALDREFGRVFQATLQDPTRYLSGGEIVLCGMRWLPGPVEAEDFVGVLAAAGVVALGAGTAEVGGPVPEHLVESCRRVGLPLFEVPLSVSFATVTERVILGLAAERSAPAHDSHRRLVAAVTSGVGLPALVSAGAAELDVDCWVLSATGRLIAGTGSPPSDARRSVLARRFLRAERLPLTVPGDDGPVTLLAAASRSGHRVASWFLVASGDIGRWASARRELALELAPLIGLERSRVDEAKRIENRAAEPLLRLALSDDAFPASLSARLAALDFPPSAQLVTLSAAVDGGGPGLTQVLVEELLASVPTPTLVATVDGETFGLFPAHDRLGRLAETLRESVRAVEPALGSARLSVGLSRAPDAAGLRSGLQEARHARTLAALSPGRAAVLAGDEVASHLLLLAAVPDDLRRSFGEKVLGPVLAYDAAHGSELLATLKAFLEHSGSWTQTAGALHLHVNTLRYRISRISELTGRDLGRFADRVDLYLAGCFTQDWGWS
ncbi:helix-turn-helix domain-containing protein [Amycolatopsis carbonis]|uniref:Helix-turn-helix domain-containing protein n=1 Tax=Amycolatopsis carbonis TaxID=715471 RepID=A0A9Y2IPL1_9PSEU|nr:helix-turn-helix domain-containing protein [Amycolatopsis sp. 2-15]WIX82428.1 helix-turn-helix domain-containing protein [Amycolatopsis sp. 2-15]